MDVVVLQGRLALLLLSSLPAEQKNRITIISVSGKSAIRRILNRKDHSLISKLDRTLMLPVAFYTQHQIVKAWNFVTPQNVFKFKNQGINSDEVMSYLNSLSPTRVLLIGTEILQSAHSISCPKIYNLHSGLAPQYRGLWNWFWPSYFKDYARNGVTIHLAEPKADAGKVILREKYLTQANDSLTTLLHKSLCAQRKILIGFFGSELSETYLPFDNPGKHLFEPGISNLIRFMLGRENS
jgi:folate-dependent phosphoribosylglycinamide formyltransferase PurN